MYYTATFKSQDLNYDATHISENQRGLHVSGFALTDPEPIEGQEDGEDKAILILDPEEAAYLLLTLIKGMNQMRIQIGKIDWEDWIIAMGGTLSGSTTHVAWDPIKYRFPNSSTY
jgi:hypothetical protein